ncbi:MAG: hypothetical protein QMD11_06050, partial [Smithella sp.]|nr:hypothetical protein [Smithella sp.]
MMDALKEILQKIEQPLTFASRDNFKNLSNIKDLGKSLLNLLPRLKNSSYSGARQEINHLADAMLEIFADYDRQKLELKKYKIEEARKLLDRLKTIIESPVTPEPVHPIDEKI